MIWRENEYDQIITQLKNFTLFRVSRKQGAIRWHEYFEPETFIINEDALDFICLNTTNKILLDKLRNCRKTIFNEGNFVNQDYYCPNTEKLQVSGFVEFTNNDFLTIPNKNSYVVEKEIVEEFYNDVFKYMKFEGQIVNISGKRLALNNDGNLTYCTLFPENIDGRCGHKEHQRDDETMSDFCNRVKL